MPSRRSLLISLVCVSSGAPRHSAAQPATKPHRIGMLSGGGLQGSNWDAFYSSMQGMGYVDGRDVVYEKRAAQGEPQRLPRLARELVATNPRLIITTGGWEVIAARQATNAIPIVMIFGTDPVVPASQIRSAGPGATSRA